MLLVEMDLARLFSKIMNVCQSALKTLEPKADLDAVTTFLASDIKQCLITTPFDPNVATQLVEYYRDALPFQSTLGYLKEPPPGYQQPAADLLGGLDAIRESINAGAFANEYDFEVALQTLIYSAHDGHLQLSGGLSSVFRFGSEFAISSVSVDGKELPKPYITSK